MAMRSSARCGVALRRTSRRSRSPAHSEMDEAHAALIAGFQVHVAKPTNPWLLTEAVANVVGMNMGEPTASSER